MAVRGLLARNFLHLNFAALTKLLETLGEMFDRITILQVFGCRLDCQIVDFKSPTFQRPRFHNQRKMLKC